MDGPASVSGGGELRRLSDSRLFAVQLALESGADGGAPAMTAGGTLTGAVTGRVVLEARPHCCIPLRTVLTVRVENGRREARLLRDHLLARSLLWACRGELAWYPHIHGFGGLIRRLEGSVGARNDVLGDAQLEFLAQNGSALIWAATVDTSVALDDHPTVTAVEPADLLAVLGEERGTRRLFLQFLVQTDAEDEVPHDAGAGWSMRSKVKIDLLQGSSPDGSVSYPISFVMDQSSQLLLRLRISGEQQVELKVANLPLSPPGVPHHIVAVFQANWTCLVLVDDVTPPVAVTIPESVRDDLALDNIVALELRANVRVALKYVLLADNEAFFEEVRYFSSRRVAAIRDAHSLAGAASRFGFSASSLTWSTLGLVVFVIAGVPLAITWLAAFDTGLIPKKGLADKPLLYFRLAPSAALTHIGVAACAALCLLVAMLFRQSPSAVPTLVAALTARTPEALLWRIAVSILTVQRIAEAYLGFKTYIDKLTEKSYRVAFPLFHFQHWLWMNRVSLVADVLETLSLFVLSLSSPAKSANLQHVALVLFHVFHLIHVFSHFRTFLEIKRSYHDDLVARLRTVLNAAVATALCAALLRAAFAVTGVHGLDAAASLSEWAFFGVTFVWHHTVQREFIAPEDTRLYVGRRIALGASVRCSECLRPFSRSRTREKCADCRDECCVDCGTEMHLSELGSTVDMTCFFCSKCHRLLQAEMAASRQKKLTTRPIANAAPPPPSLSSTSSSSLAPGGSGGGAVTDSSGGAMEVCRMFQRGECSYGESCKYLHMDSRRGRAGSRRARSTGSGHAPTTTGASGLHNLSGSESGKQLYVTPMERSGTPMPTMGSGRASDALDSSSGLDKDSLSSVERKKQRRRGKRGQRKKQAPAASGESEGFEDLMMQEADVDDEDDEGHKHIKSD